MAKVVSIQISDSDFEAMLSHFAAGRTGKPLVAVEAVIDADPDVHDDAEAEAIRSALMGPGNRVSCINCGGFSDGLVCSDCN